MMSGVQFLSTAQRVGEIRIALGRICTSEDKEKTASDFAIIIAHLEQAHLDEESLRRLAQYFLLYANDETFYTLTDLLLKSATAPS